MKGGMQDHCKINFNFKMWVFLSSQKQTNKQTIVHESFVFENQWNAKLCLQFFFEILATDFIFSFFMNRSKKALVFRSAFFAKYQVRIHSAICEDTCKISQLYLFVLPLFSDHHVTTNHKIKIPSHTHTHTQLYTIIQNITEYYIEYHHETKTHGNSKIWMHCVPL